MEYDYVHSTKETAKRTTYGFVPSACSALVILAIKKQPYVEAPMKYNHVGKYCPILKVA